MAEITLLIKRNGDELEVSVKSDTLSSPADLNQEGRRAANPNGKSHPRNREIKNLKRDRKHHGAGGRDDHDLESGPHQTMILIDGNNDKVTFECDKLFVVDVEFDPAYLEPDKAEPRRSPFKGWDNPKTGTQEAGTGPFSVLAAEFFDEKRDGIDKTRPSDHHFYKMTIWSEGLKLDPDWYCDR